MEMRFRFSEVRFFGFAICVLVLAKCVLLSLRRKSRWQFLDGELDDQNLRNYFRENTFILENIEIF
jgi:hypothetical protein